MSLNKRCRFKNLHLKLIVVGILLILISNASAYDPEVGYAEGEEMEIEYVEGYHYFYYVYPEEPNWYDPLTDLWIRISSYLFTDEEIDVTVSVVQEEWTGSQYEPKDPQVRADNTRTLTPDANQSSVTNMALDPVEDFFRNNTNAIDNFVTRDDDPEHPDVLNVSLNIAGAGVDIQEYGYTTLDDNDLDGINDKLTNPDYGFGLTGRGSGGSSGSIYEGVDMYGASGGDGSGMGSSFNTIFWCIIPLIFILSVMKLSSRVLK